MTAPSTRLFSREVQLVPADEDLTLWNVQQTAYYLSISPWTLLRLRLPGVRYSHRLVRYRPSVVRLFRAAAERGRVDEFYHAFARPGTRPMDALVEAFREHLHHLPATLPVRDRSRRDRDRGVRSAHLL